VKTITVLLAFLLVTPADASAEWQLKPFAGITFGGSHGFVDLDGTRGHVKPVFGGSLGWHWANGFGIEGEVATLPNMLKGSSGLVDTGRVTTGMANVVWRLPRPSFRLRGYVTVGIGAARVDFKDALDAFTSSSSLAAANGGGGMLLQVRSRAQFVGEIRYFRSQYREANRAGFGEEHLAYWRLASGLILAF
jgi:hypothetical protein